MEKETIMIDGMRCYADRPRSCRGCFFWKNRKTGWSVLYISIEKSAGNPYNFPIYRKEAVE